MVAPWLWQWTGRSKLSKSDGDGWWREGRMLPGVPLSVDVQGPWSSPSQRAALDYSDEAWAAL